MDAKQEDDQDNMVADDQAQQSKDQINSAVTTSAAQISTRFYRIKNLLRQIMDPQIEFGAILGAGISVSAGFSAFRSDNSVFQKMSNDYGNWPGKDECEDSFLGYAFSVSALRNDPRVQCRVLHRFDKSVHEKAIYPTLTHCFLQYLAEIGRLTRVVTQNIDDLEIDAGLEKVLGINLIQAHGAFSRPALCVNQACPAYQIIRDAKHKLEYDPKNLDEILKFLRKTYITGCSTPCDLTTKYEPQKQQHILSIDENFGKFHPTSFLNAIFDDCVPVCMYCGCALKSSMVLYEEEVNLPCALQKTLFLNCKSLLVIGTSLNVEPVNHLPAYISSNASIHIMSKEINFQKYLTETHEESEMFTQIIQRRMDHIKYKTGEENRQILLQHLALENGLQTFNSKVINGLTPLFCFHEGECDHLVEDILEFLPEAKKRIYEIRDLAIKNSKRTRQKPNYILEENQRKLTYKYVDRTAELQLVMLSIPCLWQPDAVIYYQPKFKCYSTAVLMMKEQLDLVMTYFGPHLRIDTIDISGELCVILIDTRYTEKFTLDRAIYQPLGNHWSTYCIAYNKYEIASDRYREDLDPWSSSFIGYQSKRIYYNVYTNFFCYQGVWRNFHTMMKNPNFKVSLLMQTTQHVLLGEDYECLLYPVLFDKPKEIGDV